MSDWSTKQRIFIYLLFLISLAFSILQMKNTYLYGSLYDLNFFYLFRSWKKLLWRSVPRTTPKNQCKKLHDHFCPYTGVGLTPHCKAYICLFYMQTVDCYLIKVFSVVCHVHARTLNLIFLSVIFGWNLTANAPGFSSATWFRSYG